MSAGWEVGDLALCVNAAPSKYHDGIECRLRTGCVYTVKLLGRARLAPYSLILDGPEASDEHLGFGWSVHRFRKVLPDQHEACESEFVTLLKRSKKRVTA